MSEVPKHTLSLGGINKKTGDYTCPKLANKKDEYICPDCEKDLVLCQGEIRVCYFRHVTDDKDPCNYYNKPTEAQIHKDGKMLIKHILDKKIPVKIGRVCPGCKYDYEHEIPEITESSSIELEYRFEYNGPKVADVAYMDNDDPVCIFEIFNTHKTSCEDRPEPWFEIDANKLIHIVNSSDLSSITIPCIRKDKCADCIISEKEKIKRDKITKLQNEITSNSSSSSNRISKLDSDDDADTYRFMRYHKQDANHKKSILIEIELVTNDIEYTLGNHVVTIKHPITNTTVRRSLIKTKTCYKNTWYNKISLSLIMKWYKSTSIDDIKDLESLMCSL